MLPLLTSIPKTAIFSARRLPVRTPERINGSRPRNAGPDADRNNRITTATWGTAIISAAMANSPSASRNPAKFSSTPRRPHVQPAACARRTELRILHNRLIRSLRNGQHAPTRSHACTKWWAIKIRGLTDRYDADGVWLDASRPRYTAQQTGEVVPGPPGAAHPR